LATSNVSIAQSAGEPRLPLPLLLFGDLPDQIRGDAFRIGFKQVDELSIPIMVEVAGLEAVGGDLLVVAAAVVVVR
jgi:hypothetical protein